jgi:hypothetical protein
MHSIAIQLFPKRRVAFADPLIQNLAQRGHKSILRLV